MWQSTSRYAYSGRTGSRRSAAAGSRLGVDSRGVVASTYRIVAPTCMQPALSAWGSVVKKFAADIANLVLSELVVPRYQV